MFLAGLWGLVNNAGIQGNRGYYDWWTRDEFRRILEVNLLGPVEVTNVFSPLLRKAKGRVVNVSSAVVFLAAPNGGYEMSKSALEAYSDSLRLENNFNIGEFAKFANANANANDMITLLSFRMQMSMHYIIDSLIIIMADVIIICHDNDFSDDITNACSFAFV